jgi:YidC/Oxa1 family membrane protein insertase
MIKMQKLQPQIAELKKKYGDDQKSMNEEQMKLFRRYGVNPFGGCLPMLLQLPILIALFRGLREAYALRHASFLYISDLSRPDQLFDFPESIPLIGGVAFNALPIVWGALMLGQQKLMHRPAASEQAAQQQAMFKWMPLFFVFFLYGMPSGLLVYWVTSTAVGMCERLWVERHARDIELEPVEEAARKRKSRGAGGADGKKGWFARMMEAGEKYMEEQERKARQSDDQRRKDRKKK